MGWIGKLFGQRTATEWLEQADRAWTLGDHGAAKLSYDGALSAADLTADQRTHAQARVTACRDKLAESRLVEAERLLEVADDKSRALARDELRSAMEIAASEPVLQRTRALAETLERGAARQHVESLSATDEDLLAGLAGTWEDDQADEYESYGEPLSRALLALHHGQITDAVSALQALAGSAKEPRYLHFELGRALLASGDSDGGEQRLRLFLTRIGPDEGGEARLIAHLELAGLVRDRGDFEGAVQELETAIEALPEDPRAYLTLGVFLRTEGHAAEALEVLDAAQVVLGETRREWRLTQELGLCRAALGEDARAIELLEDVVQTFTAQRLTDLPAETATTLAQLHEKQGNKVRAADLYSALSRGSDRERLYEHHLAAGRLLVEVGQSHDGLRMLQQAVELARTDEEKVAAEALSKAAC